MEYLPVDFLNRYKEFEKFNHKVACDWVRAVGKRRTFNLIMCPQTALQHTLEDFIACTGIPAEDCIKSLNLAVMALVDVEWSEKKLSYRVSENIENYQDYVCTDLPEDVINALPAECFFIDVSKIPNMTLGGIFVVLSKTRRGMDLALVSVPNVKCKYKDYKVISTLYLPYQKDTGTYKWSLAGKDEYDKVILEFFYHFLMYYCDIQFNKKVVEVVKEEKRKNTSHPSKPSKGVRISSPITNVHKKYVYKKKSETSNTPHEKRPIRSHYRSGHWHHYWKGRGSDRKLIVRWVEGVEVKGTKDKIDEVIIHDVK